MIEQDIVGIQSADVSWDLERKMLVGIQSADISWDLELLDNKSLWQKISYIPFNDIAQNTTFSLKILFLKKMTVLNFTINSFV